MLDLRTRFEFRFHPGQGVRDSEAFAEEESISLLERRLRFFGNLIPLEPHLVDGAGMGWVSIREHERRHVLDDFGTSPHNGHPANSTELVDGGEATYVGVILDEDMSGQRRDVGHDHVISNLDVMGDMTVGQEMIVRTDHRGAAIRRRTMNRDMLAERIAVANLGSGQAALPFQVLGFEPNAGEGKQLIALPQTGMTIDHNVGMQPTTSAEHHMLANHTIGTDFAVRSNFRARMNDSCRMNQGGAHAYPSMSMKATSASLTVSPFTEQTPRALPILPRDLVNTTLITRASPGRTGLRHFTDSADMK